MFESFEKWKQRKAEELAELDGDPSAEEDPESDEPESDDEPTAEQSAPVAEVKESSAEAEKRRILEGDFWEATLEELEKMTPDQYARWRAAGGHQKKETPPEEKPVHSVGEMAALETFTPDELAAWKQKMAAQRQAEYQENHGRYSTPW